MMKEIRTDLYTRGLGQQFETFIRVNFPMIIEPEAQTAAQPPQAKTGVQQQAVAPKLPPRIAPAAAINKHGVFKNYRAGLLTFPHKKIFTNSNKQHLQAIVDSFIRGKVSTDYVIVEDYAYVEYFNPVYTAQAEQIPKESRDIYQYKAKNGLR
jgi:hypothetical protein